MKTASWWIYVVVKVSREFDGPWFSENVKAFATRAAAKKCIREAPLEGWVNYEIQKLKVEAE